jgi:hypothetical protein
MRTFVIAEVGFFALVGLLFLVVYATGSRWRASFVGRNVMEFVAGIVAFVIALLVSLVWRVPTWVFAVIFAELNYAICERLWLVWRGQRQSVDDHRG